MRGLKVGAPRVSLAALSALHELLVALESRLPSLDGTTVTEEAHHGIAEPLAGRTELAVRRQIPLTTASRQLDLVLDDVRLRGMTQEERSQALTSLAHLLIEACGMAMREAGDDIE